jgi:8-oxo-dGTP pyrophosphatase MutT (NUDIX family)
MPKIPTQSQVSAGGVAYRHKEDRYDVALISVGKEGRWQLPKGQVEHDQTPEETAVREVLEEAGLETEIVEPLDTIEYWFYGRSEGERIRIHKFVHFFLMKCLSGDTKNHDWEVNEARWVPLDQAVEKLTFENEKQVLEKARQTLTKPQ